MTANKLRAAARFLRGVAILSAIAGGLGMFAYLNADAERELAGLLAGALIGLVAYAPLFGLAICADGIASLLEQRDRGGIQ